MITNTECTAVATPRIAFHQAPCAVWRHAAAAVLNSTCCSVTSAGARAETVISIQGNVSRRRPRSTSDGLPHLFGEVECFEHLGRPEPDDELAGHTVAAAIFIGPVGTHVAGTGAGRDVEKIIGIFTDRRDALHLYE